MASQQLVLSPCRCFGVRLNEVAPTQYLVAAHGRMTRCLSLHRQKIRNVVFSPRLGFCRARHGVGDIDFAQEALWVSGSVVRFQFKL